MEDITPKYCKGGIGDFLLRLQSAIDANVINVFSHFSKAPDLFSPFGVKVNRFEYFDSVEELNGYFVTGEELEPHTHPKFPMPNPPLSKHNEKIIGIHIEGSKFSNVFWEKLGKPSKNMTNVFLLGLIEELTMMDSSFVFYIFSSPNRKEELTSLLSSLNFRGRKPNVRIVAYDNIWDSLSCVRNCDFVIGMDSSIKTLSSILSIPTITLVGDYEDKFRDDTFLLPYVREGTMQVIKFSNINSVKPSDVSALLRL